MLDSSKPGGPVAGEGCYPPASIPPQAGFTAPSGGVLIRSCDAYDTVGDLAGPSTLSARAPPTPLGLDRDWEESPFAAVRLRTAAVENATAVIWKTLLVAEKTFRRLDAPELLAAVARSEVYVNTVRAVNRRTEDAAPDLISTLLDKTSGRSR